MIHVSWERLIVEKKKSIAAIKKLTPVPQNIAKKLK